MKNKWLRNTECEVSFFAFNRSSSYPDTVIHFDVFHICREELNKISLCWLVFFLKLIMSYGGSDSSFEPLKLHYSRKMGKCFEMTSDKK